ncbi:uncharacterized protein A4U43_C06F11030 [Asparagus officinalis]|uniref:Uncharacterized protein n=1 Tax=Asparagus officinalis TaxID=4686 RepID=A0A5P1ENH3_ASPOF|nr:uncharacterized protein A4U43_C06F11030 [Asparagus officinalis]
MLSYLYQFPEERKLDLLKTLAGCSPYATAQDSRQLLPSIVQLLKVAMKKLTQGMAEHNKAMSAAKDEETKAKVKLNQQKDTTGLRVCNNILAMTQPLHSKAPTFIGDNKIKLSWNEPAKASPASTIGAKRAASTTNGSVNNNAKKGRGFGPNQNQNVNRAFDGLSHGGGRGRGRGRSWGNRGRGRGYR